jgi:hypothetical protein
MLEGEISEIDLVARLVELWREQFTGAIRFENDGIIKIVYFKGGDILSASTNDRADSIDEILMRAGKVSREHVKQALAKRKESETLGDALLNLGFITRKELTWARRVQVVGVIRSIAAWTNGTFTIVADYLPKRDEGTLFPLPQVLVELVVTDQDRSTFERALDGGAAVFAKSPDFDDVFHRLGLNDDAEAIASEIDGVKSAAEVATASRRDTFNAYKLMHALATLGILKRAGQTAAPEPQFALDDFASAGVADAADMFNDPQPAPAPQFDFDEAEARSQPTLEVALDAAPVASAAAAAASAWDEPDEEVPPPQVTTRTPAWDTPPRAAAVPIPVPVPAAAEAEEEQWGFDEAQLETAKRATTPARSSTPPPPKEGRRYGLLLTLMVIFMLAAAAYFGLRWWQGREEMVAAPLAVARPARKAPRPVPATDTVVPVTTTQPVAATVTIAAATETVGTTTVTERPNAPLLITTAPPPEPSASQPLPTVVRKQGGTRYDAMAREYAAHPSGNFTVQIQILCEQSNLDKAILVGSANVWFVPQTIGTRSCYRLFWGHYATREEAQQALPTIPATLRDRSSAVKPVPK